MKTYVVTGGAGFIGSNFILYLLSSYPDVRVINVDKLTYAGNLNNLTSLENDSRYIFVRADICDSDKMHEVLSKYVPNYVVNFAAESHVDRSIIEPDVFARTNVMGTVNLLNCTKQLWEDRGLIDSDHKFIQISTDEVYGTLSLENPEELFTEETPLCPHSPYSASKASADLFVKSYGDTYRFPVNITRCSNNYGPYQFPEKLIPLMINNALNHRKLPIYGDGLNVRDWLHVEDHCRAIDLVIKHGIEGEVYNVGGNNERSNIDLVKNIISILKQTIDSTISEELIHFVVDRKGHDRRYGIDSSKIQKYLGWYPSISFETGIGKTIQWYLDNEDWMQEVTTGTYRDYYHFMYGAHS